MIAVNLDTFEVFWFESQHEASRQLNANQSHISKVVKGRYNKTGGYWFTNADSTAIEKTRKKFGDGLANKVEKLIREHM